MTKDCFTIPSAFDGLKLHVSVYEPDGDKKGVFQILHGMCEYKERYDELMQFLAANGYVAVCHDQRGHGDSVLQKEDRGYFYETQAKAIVDDAAQITEYIKKQYAGLPITLFGHSMGSMVARCYLQRYDDLVDKAIICGSPSKNPLSGIAIGLTKCIALFRGKRHRSKMLTYLSTGKGNDRFKGEGKGAWLSKNRKNIDEFHANEKGDYRFTCNGFENLFRLMRNTYDVSAYEVKNANLPVHFLSGEDDAVLGGREKFFETMAELKRAGYNNVTGRLFEGMRHEVHNETDNGVVLDEILSFLQS